MTRNVSFRIGFPSNDFTTFKTLAQLGFGKTEKISGDGFSASPKEFITAMYLRAVESSRESTQMMDEFDYFRIFHREEGWSGCYLNILCQDLERFRERDPIRQGHLCSTIDSRELAGEGKDRQEGNSSA